MSTWQTMRVAHHSWLAPEVLCLRLSAGADFSFLPGQYCEIRLPGDRLSRAYSFASRPTDDFVELGIRVYKDSFLSGRLAQLTDGAVVELRGPLGGYFRFDAAHQVPLLLLAGGVGVVPLISFLRTYALRFDEPVRLLVSHRLRAQSIYRTDLARLADQNDKLIVHEFYTREPNVVGRITQDILTSILDDFPLVQTRGYLSGPTDFVLAMHTYLTSLGLPVENLRLEYIAPS